MANETTRETLSIARIEIAERPHEARVILSNGAELTGLMSIHPHEITPNSLAEVTLRAVVLEKPHA